MEKLDLSQFEKGELREMYPIIFGQYAGAKLYDDGIKKIGRPTIIVAIYHNISYHLREYIIKHNILDINEIVKIEVALINKISDSLTIPSEKMNEIILNFANEIERETFKKRD